MIKVAAEKNQAIKPILNIKVQTKSAGHSGLCLVFRRCWCFSPTAHPAANPTYVVGDNTTTAEKSSNQVHLETSRFRQKAPKGSCLKS